MPFPKQGLHRFLGELSANVPGVEVQDFAGLKGRAEILRVDDYLLLLPFHDRGFRSRDAQFIQKQGVGRPQRIICNILKILFSKPITSFLSQIFCQLFKDS